MREGIKSGQGRSMESDVAIATWVWPVLLVVAAAMAVAGVVTL